jgi:hypothetical protein
MPDNTSTAAEQASADRIRQAMEERRRSIEQEQRSRRSSGLGLFDPRPNLGMMWRRAKTRRIDQKDRCLHAARWRGSAEHPRRAALPKESEIGGACSSRDA